MRRRFRLLPIVIFAAALTFTLRVGEIFRDAGNSMVSTRAAHAESESRAAPAAGSKDARNAKKQDNAGEPGDTPANTPEAHASGAAHGQKEKGVGDEFDPRSVTEAEFDVLQRLAKRRNELDKLRRDLDLRESLLKATERRLDAKLAELNKIKKTIGDLLLKHEKEQEKKLQSLVSIYEKMKPKKAAAIFEKLEMNIVLDVVERMREAKTAPIFAAMDPARAKEITANLAERRQLPRMNATTTGG